MMLACMFTFGLAACGDDEEEDSSYSYETKILGTWVYENEFYQFKPDGTGLYESGGDVWGDFKYNLSGNIVYIRITYVNSNYGTVWRNEKNGIYNSDDDTFRIDGTRYVRKK